MRKTEDTTDKRIQTHQQNDNENVNIYFIRNKTIGSKTFIRRNTRIDEC